MEFGQHEARPWGDCEPLDRYAFYGRADTAFAIVQCVGGACVSIYTTLSHLLLPYR